jgi:hypothetical protein
MHRKNEYKRLPPNTRKRGWGGKKRAIESSMGKFGHHIRAAYRSVEEDR